MATITGPLTLTIRPRRKLLLYVAVILYKLDGDREGMLCRAADWLVDHCMVVG